MISLIIGPMFSGKTTELERQTMRQVLAGKSAVAIKYSRDNRYSSDKIISHNNVELDLPTILISDISDLYVSQDVIAIDEGQFINGLPEWVEAQANSGKHVIISGLDADFLRQSFPNIVQLIPKAEKVKKLSAVCECGKNAAFSKILVETDKIENIGGKELYKPVCRSCYVL